MKVPRRLFAVGLLAALPFTERLACAEDNPSPPPPEPSCMASLHLNATAASAACYANSMPQCKEYTAAAFGSNNVLYRGSKWVRDGSSVIIYAPPGIKFRSPHAAIRTVPNCI